MTKANLKCPENLNLKQAKSWFKNSKIKIKKTKKKIPKKGFKKITKTATISILAFPLIIDWKITFFIVINFLMFVYYKYFCKMVDQRNQARIQKMKKYKNKSEGVKKRMANLKQFKKV